MITAYGYTLVHESSVVSEHSSYGFIGQAIADAAQ